MRKCITVVFVLLSMVLLSSCLYPNEMRKDQNISPRESVMLVQTAVEQYIQLTGVPPIKNFEMDTPYYEKYVIDFGKMIERGAIGQIPATAFEKGGSYFFVLVNPETDPQVKMMDVHLIQQVGDVQRAVDQYKRKHDGEIPLQDEISNDWFYIDYSKMRIAPVQLPSPFTTQTISLMIHQSGVVMVNYAPEIMRIMQQEKIDSPPSNHDLREVLVNHSYFVPVKSVTYHWVDGEPRAELPQL